MIFLSLLAMNTKTAILLLISVLLCGTASSTPGRTDGTIDYIKDNFKTPPSSHGLDCWWWWLNSNVTEEAISSDLEAMKEKGFYGAMIFDAGGHNQRGNRNIPAGPVFASKEWRKLFVHALDEAERLGLEIGFNIQSGWNLGGPCITPEHAAKMLTYSETRVSGGNETVVNLPRPASRLDYYKDIAVLAFPLDPSRVSDEPVRGLDLKLGIHELGGSAPDCRFLLTNDPASFRKTDARPLVVNSSEVLDVTRGLGEDGSLKWRFPDGDWAILRIGYTCTGAVVSTCSKGWDGLVLDYMSPDAFDHYISEVVIPIFEDAGHHVGKTLKFLETDSWECGGMNWTKGFEKWFRTFNGYDIMPYLPVIAGYIVDDVTTCDSFLADFRKTIAESVAVNHYKRFAEFAHSKGMGIQPESAGPHAGPLDGIRNYSFSDIVMSEFWAPSPHRPRTADRFFVKQASSAAHVYGKRIVGAESFTTIGPHWNDEIWHNQKPSFDHEICSGLNRTYFHTFTCSPSEMGLPGQEYFAGTHINPRLTWWDEASAFMDYLARIQLVAQNGKFVADALYYYGDHVPNVLPFKHSDIARTIPGYDYDAIDENVLLSLEITRGGFLKAPSGLEYRALILPSHKTLSFAALKKVGRLVRKGAVVIGDRPEHCVSLKGGAKAQARFAALADRIWAGSNAKGITRFGKGSVVTGMTANEYFHSQGLPADFSIAEDATLRDFDYIHYTVDGRDFYFISNMTDRPADVTCSFRVHGRRPESWNALDGTILSLEAFSQAGGITSVPIHFDPCGSALIAFDGKIPDDCQGTAASNCRVPSATIPVDGSWDVSFDPKWGGPAHVVFDKLIDWTESEDDGIRYYSGKAGYSKSFSMPEVDRDKYGYAIDLGSVKDVGFASVKVNGVDKGVVWTAPFRVDVTDAIRQGENHLEVVVVNSWFNRVTGDQQHPEGKTYTSTNIDLGNDFLGRKKASITLSPSGLLGPVSVVIF